MARFSNYLLAFSEGTCYIGHVRRREWDGKRPPPRPGLSWTPNSYGWRPSAQYWLRRDAMEKLGDSCACCGRRDWSKLELDHIVPPALDESRERVKEAGGPYNAALREPERFQLLCKSCNLRKRRGARWARL